MKLIFAIMGGTLGVIVASSGGHEMVGLFAGLIIGVLLARLNSVEQRISQLESVIKTLRLGDGEPEAEQEKPDWKTIPKPWPSSERTWPDSDSPRQPKDFSEDKFPETLIGPDFEPAPEALTRTTGEKHRTVLKDDWTTFQSFAFDRLTFRLKNWLTTGNVPVKVGVIVSFIGVSFLLKYAIDRDLISISLEVRLIAVALAGTALVAIGWRLRHRMRIYALSLQGGGLGILFLTIYAALRIWQLLPALPAFILLVFLTACMGVLALLQNSRSLAILGIVGGFLAPVLTSTGQGSHVILFSYYLVLNCAILGVSWFRAWRSLNLIGFVFTFIISSLWGYQYFKPALFASTEPFLVLYFLFYLAISILYALRQPPERLGTVDGTLVFGTPVIVFALQSQLVRDAEYGLAISAACIAVLYALTATWLSRKKGDYLKLISESFLALAVAFATIAIPLALDARWTSAAWALEGAALVWIGVRQERHLANFAGLLLMISSGFAFVLFGWRHDLGLPVLNGNVLGGLMISAGSLFASKQLDSFKINKFKYLYQPASIVLFAWGLLWWLATGWMESADRLLPDRQYMAFLLFIAFSAALVLSNGRFRSWSKLQSSTLLFLPLFTSLALEGWDHNRHLLVGLGWVAWPAAITIQGLVLRRMDSRHAFLVSEWHIATLLLTTAMFAIEVDWWSARVASAAWAHAAAVTSMGIVALIIWRFHHKATWPVREHPGAYLGSSIILVAFQAISLTYLSIRFPGNSEPLPYIPLFNPFSLAMLFSMTTAVLSFKEIRHELRNGIAAIPDAYVYPYRILLAAAFFIMTTTALVRGVHHYGSVPWRFDALFASVLVQTALSIYWGVLGFSGMIIGARTKRRVMWVTGAGFMVLVVIKLFLVDLGNSGTVERIISFIGIGTLLILVGYFAPVPPKEAAATAADGNRRQEKPED
ncbi:DUF2339 domain-containing protein [Pseudomonadota bacterium]